MCKIQTDIIGQFPPNWISDYISEDSNEGTFFKITTKIQEIPIGRTKICNLITFCSGAFLLKSNFFHEEIEILITLPCVIFLQ